MDSRTLVILVIVVILTALSLALMDPLRTSIISAIIIMILSIYPFFSSIENRFQKKNPHYPLDWDVFLLVKFLLGLFIGISFVFFIFRVSRIPEVGTGISVAAIMTVHVILFYFASKRIRKNKNL